MNAQSSYEVPKLSLFYYFKFQSQTEWRNADTSGKFLPNHRSLLNHPPFFPVHRKNLYVFFSIGNLSDFQITSRFRFAKIRGREGWFGRNFLDADGEGKRVWRLEPILTMMLISGKVGREAKFHADHSVTSPKIKVSNQNWSIWSVFLFLL